MSKKTTEKVAATEKAEKKPKLEAVKAPKITIEKMTDTAHAEIGNGVVTVYPDLTSTVSIVNDRRGSIPTNLIVEAQAHSMLLIPNPENPNVSLSTPVYLAPGRHKIERCSIKNRGVMVERLTNDCPLFDIVFIPACTAEATVIELEGDPKEAA